MSKLQFNISTGLKNIIGKELITNKEIAVFELVKNSYDAFANSVKIIFDSQNGKKSIVIQDDGEGMDYEKLRDNWLFVAYSDKKNDTRLSRVMAGAKGVGRFSCDRLGSRLKLITKVKSEHFFHQITIDWNDFEKDSKEQFANIEVDYQKLNYYKNPSISVSGTILEISDLRDDWNAEDKLKLKKSLRRLVNPNKKIENLDFQIYLQSNEDLQHDKKQKSFMDEINGYVVNNLFEEIFDSAVSINVKISEDGNFIETELFDRGTFVFNLREANTYSYLKNINAKIYYLNRSAKNRCTRIMGTQSVNYGSVFIYKNNFRIMKYGEPGLDFFNIDKRKAQGYNRYFGTREIIGSIEILGKNIGFIESTSRDGGFIENAHTKQLKNFYMKHVHRILEKYAVDIIKFGQPVIKNDLKSAIKPEEAFEDTLNYFNKDKYISKKFNPDFLKLLKDRQKNSAISQIDDLSREFSDNSEVYKKLENVKKKTSNILNAKLEAESELENSKSKNLIYQKEIKTLDRRNTFLSNAVSRNITDVLFLIHQNKNDCINIQDHIDDIKDNLDSNKEKILKHLATISRLNARILANNKIIESGNFIVNTHNVVINLCEFINDYISQFYKNSSIGFIFMNEDKNIKLNIEPSRLINIVDNLVSNSKKHGAKNIIFDYSQDDYFVDVIISDDGEGLADHISYNDLGKLGLTTTNGSGLGLYNIKSILSKISGRIEFDKEYQDGFRVKLKFRKWVE
jgi:signal transduction histidine kinase